MLCFYSKIVKIEKNVSITFIEFEIMSVVCKKNYSVCLSAINLNLIIIG